MVLCYSSFKTYTRECQVPWLGCACLVTQSCLTLCDPMDCSPPGSSVHGESPGKNTRGGCMPASRISSQSRDRTQVSHMAGRFFTNWATKEALVRIGLNTMLRFFFFLKLLAERVWKRKIECVLLLFSH